MSALTRTYRNFIHPSDSFREDTHSTTSIVGVVCAGLALVTFLAFLPDLIRYLKMSRM